MKADVRPCGKATFTVQQSCGKIQGDAVDVVLHQLPKADVNAGHEEEEHEKMPAKLAVCRPRPFSKDLK